MRNFIISILLVATSYGCVQKINSKEENIETKGPFHIVLEETTNDNNNFFQKVQSDFNLVLQGKKPIHAKLDSKGAKLLDGGTENYIGENYKLTIIKRLGTVGGINGYFYGPVVSFDDGASAAISKVDFYSPKQLELFLKK